MEFAEDGRKERGQGVFARVLSNRKINAIVTCIDSADNLGVLRDNFFEAVSKKHDPLLVRQLWTGGPDDLGKAFFDMNVESVKQRCAEFPSLRLRGMVMPHYKFRPEKASLVRVYDAVKELQDQCWTLSSTLLFHLLEQLKMAVADEIIDRYRELLAGKGVVAS